MRQVEVRQGVKPMQTGMRADAARAKPKPSAGYATVSERSMDLAVKGRFGEAVSLLEGFIEENPAHIEALRKLMRMHIAAGNVAGAESAYRAAKRRSALGDSLDVLMINVYCEAKEFDKALEIMESEPSGRLVSEDACARAFRFYLDRKDFDGVLRVLAVAFKKCAPPKESLLELISAMGRDCVERIIGSVRASAPLCGASERPFIYSNLISTLKELGMTDAAQRVFKLAQDNGSVDKVVCNSMLAAYSIAGRRDEAEELFDSAERTGLLTPHVFTSMVGLYSKAGDMDAAAEAYEKAWSAGMQDPHLVTVMTTAYLWRKEYAEAKSVYDRACERGVSDVVLHGTMVRLNIKADRHEDAIDAFNSAVSSGQIDVRICGEIIKAFRSGTEREIAFELLGEACNRTDVNAINVAILLDDLLARGRHDDAERVVGLLPNSLKRHPKLTTWVRKASEPRE